MYIVLGRFQPFHKGHAYLIEEAMKLGPTTIAIGSSEAEMSSENPWSADEREEMIICWLDGRDANIVKIPDINDPPNWVKHATSFHGLGTLVTSDLGTKNLYESAGFEVVWVDLNDRENYEGWRVRTTLKMLSTVHEVDAKSHIMKVTIPEQVTNWLIENDALHRLYSMSKDIEHVG